MPEWCKEENIPLDSEGRWMESIDFKFPNIGINGGVYGWWTDGLAFGATWSNWPWTSRYLEISILFTFRKLYRFQKDNIWGKVRYQPTHAELEARIAERLGGNKDDRNSHVLVSRNSGKECESSDCGNKAVRNWSFVYRRARCWEKISSLAQKSNIK